MALPDHPGPAAIPEAPMSLTLHSHPLASFCWKVLIALHDTGTPFRAELVDFSDPGSQARLLDLWPVGKMPVLHDAARDRVVPESSIIIEYLDRHYPSDRRLLPADPEARLEVRLWDRFFDLYIHDPMQRIVADRIRPEADRDPYGVTEAERRLDVAYAMADRQAAKAPWAAGDTFSLADCAAAPALFYARVVRPFPAGADHLAAYAERLLDRPSVARVIDEARPWFRYYPFADRLPARYRDPG